MCWYFAYVMEIGPCRMEESICTTLVRYNCPNREHCMLLPHHGFTVLLTENSKVPIEISKVLSVFSIVLTVFPCVPAALPCEKVMVVCLSLCSSYTELTLRYKLPL